MKYILSLIALAFFYNLKGQSTNKAIITYKVSVSENSFKNYNENFKINIKSKKAIDFWKHYYDKSNYSIGILNINGLNSSYRIEKKLKKNSDNRLNIMDVLAGGSRIYYANLLKKETIMQDCDLLGKCFLIYDSFYKWRVTSKTKMINGYNCFLATSEIRNGKNTVLAWFTDKIPISTGPMYYSGLPGLVLELDDGDINFKVKRIEINPNRKIEISKLNKGVSISYEEFIKLSKKSFPKELFKN